MPLLPVSELEKFSPLFRGKAGNMFAGFLRRILSVKTLSDLNDKLEIYQGADFAGALLKELNLDFKIAWSERLESLPEGPFITVSNHPYGGMDGIILVDLLGHARPDFKVMVNEFLNLIKPLSPSWIVVNPKNDIQKEVTSKNIQGVKEVLTHLRDGHPVGFFPSGAVSDLSLKEFKIRDREWQVPLLRLIQKARVPIVPVRFFDHNSMWFYYLGLIDWRVRTLQLPHEIVNKKLRKIRVGIGETIPVEEQARHKETKEFGKWLRDKVYGMTFPKEYTSYKDLTQG
ncbi:MAG: lysophospholipid acyltransferase family protein [Bacteroidales bacterium]|nr:lysophospholipid acyltransferase family protein [Bacteroidales bacterium]